MSQVSHVNFSSLECVRKLGTGTYGSVFLVRISSLKKTYAMKVLNSANLSKKQRDMIGREIEIMAMLKHPNVVRYKRAYVTKETEINIIMEYADLGDLGHVITEAKPSVTQLHGEFSF